MSNSNWLVETTGADGEGARFILTMYERRIALDDLPYFLGLLDHLSARGCAVPRTIHDREGARFRMVDGKAAALIEFLPGISPDEPSAAQAHALGAALAQMHLAGRDFPLERANAMGLVENCATLEACGSEALARIDADLPAMIGPARAAAALDTGGLPRAHIHADLFPDNVLMLGDSVSGMIDFYFACTDTMALDLATTHAAWAFGPDNRYRPAIGASLINGYETVRSLERAERALLPELAKGACLRFVASRAEDWLDTPDDALVTRKDPMEFVARWHYYDETGQDSFA
ncbi:homoserine kinase [Qipengyuania nanhaisediminis]